MAIIISADVPTKSAVLRLGPIRYPSGCEERFALFPS